MHVFSSKTPLNRGTTALPLSNDEDTTQFTSPRTCSRMLIGVVANSGNLASVIKG